MTYATYKTEKDAENNLIRLKKSYPKEFHYRVGLKVYSRKKQQPTGFALVRRIGLRSTRTGLFGIKYR